MNTLHATLLAVSLALAGNALADDKHNHDVPATPGKAEPAKAKPAKPTKKAGAEHDHAHCHMMEGGMMGKGGMMASNPSDAVTKRIDQLEKRLDMMQAMMEQMMRRQDGTAPMMPMK